MTIIRALWALAGAIFCVVFWACVLNRVRCHRAHTEHHHLRPK